MKNYLIICVIVVMGLWGCGSANFTDVEKGKIDLDTHEMAAIRKLISKGRPKPEELIVFRELSEYKYTNGYFKIFIENGRVKALTLISARLERMDALSPLIEIRVLDLSYNQIKEIRGLEKAAKLEELILTQNKITQARGLEGCVSLKRLHLGENELTTLPDLSKLPLLERLNLRDNRIVLLEGLQEGKRLTHLDLTRNQLTSAAGIRDLPHLIFLFLEGNQIVSLEGMEGLPALGLVNLKDNQLTSVEELPGFSKLYSIDLRWNYITRLPKFDRELNDLYIEGNPVAGDMREALESAGQPTYAFEKGTVKSLPSGSGTLSKGTVSKHWYTNTSGVLGGKKKFRCSKSGMSLTGVHGMDVLPSSFSGAAARVELSVSSGVVRIYLKNPGTYGYVKDRYGNKSLRHIPGEGYIYAAAVPGQSCTLVGLLMRRRFGPYQIVLQAVEGSASGISYVVTDTHPD